MQLRESTGNMTRLRVAVAAAAVLQVAIAPQISIAGGAFNFMVALAMTLSLSSDTRSAVFIGFFAGLFFDLTSSSPIGLMSLLLTVSCFLVSTAARGSLGGFSRESVRLGVLAILIVNLIYGFCLFLMGLQSDLLWALLGHGIASAVLDSIAATAFLAFMGSGSSSRGFTARTKTSRINRYKVLK